MLNYIWAIIIIGSIICSFFTGNTTALGESILSSANEAVELIISMTGILCLWSGIMEIGERSGITKAVAKLLSPILTRLFPTLDKNGKAYRAICMNVTANLLGLGNAATPLGLKAMKALEEESVLAKETHTADKNMIMFIILNTTSFQLMPTMIISILQSNGCTSPSAVIPYIWAASVAGIIVGIVSVNLFYKRKAGSDVF
ncbi:MAG: nucleoside recognition domain-containing protein [Acutalibacteraceae bacterium]|nr:spore maturation protein A [Clostridia bacterium]MEE3449688.1 nucleoside recognition domain-containing protein [Acutalibacteraceae bacterium]